MVYAREVDLEEGDVPNAQQLKLDQFSELVLLFILDVVKTRKSKTKMPSQ